MGTEAGIDPVLGTTTLLAGGGLDPGERAEPAPTDDAVVLFTSGTTGTPKAVPLTHGSLAPRVASFSPSVDPVPAVSIMCVPLVHVGGMLGLLVALARGSTTVVQTRFDAGEWLALVAAARGHHRVHRARPCCTGFWSTPILRRRT